MHAVVHPAFIAIDKDIDKVGEDLRLIANALYIPEHHGNFAALHPQLLDTMREA